MIFPGGVAGGGFEENVREEPDPQLTKIGTVSSASENPIARLGRGVRFRRTTAWLSCPRWVRDRIAFLRHFRWYRMPRRLRWRAMDVIGSLDIKYLLDRG